MLWFLVLHIIALTCWCAAQLYIPALVMHSRATGSGREAPLLHDGAPRVLYLYFSNPAALLTIIAGTGVFLLNRTIEPWLMMKLFLVVLLVVIHALTGFVVLRSHEQPEKPVLLWCCLLAALFFTCMAVIFWLVLAKPAGFAPMGAL